MSTARNKYLFLCAFVAVELALALVSKNVWWDSAVYIGMGKYLYSAGNAGLFEASRPLMLPIILGLFRSIAAAKAVAVLFSAGLVLFTYLVAKELFNEEAALLSSVFLVFTPVFFFFAKIPLTGIVSAFFGMAGIFAYTKDRPFASGLLLGTAAMTRFLAAFMGIIVLALLLKERKAGAFAAGYAMITAPYFISNYVIYGNALYPFLFQAYLTKTTGWMLFRPFWFYLWEIMKNNYLAVFFIPAMWSYLKKPKNHAIAMISLFYIAFFSVIRHKEARFMVSFLPFMYMMSADAMLRIIKPKKAIMALVGVFVIISSYSIAAMENAEIARGFSQEEFSKQLSETENRGIWVSNPIMLVHSDRKADWLMYYSDDQENMFKIMEDRLDEAEHIFLDACDIECSPFSEGCREKKKEFINEIKARKTMEKNYSGKCEKLIFSSP